MGIFTVLSDIIGERIEATVKQAVSPLPGYLRKLASGMLVIILSIGAFVSALIFLALGFFFAVANFHTLMVASLWTSLVAGLTAILIFMIGLLLLRKPR